jgi:hypothetical protein
VIVAIPEAKLTLKFAPKSIVPAVPTRDPSSLITIPELLAVTPVRALPSIAGSAPVSCPAGMLVSPAPEPENDVAVTTPITLTLPDTVSLDVAFVVPIPTLPITSSKFYSSL